MRYFVGQSEHKWSHKDTVTEMLWVRRAVGDELFKTVEENNWNWVLLRSETSSLPSDIYCRCDIYVDVDPSPSATMFALKFPSVKPVHKVTP